MASHTLPILVGVIIAYVALVGLFVVTVKSRRASPDPPGDVDRYLRRTDLLDEGKRPEDPLEWIIVLSQRVKLLTGFILLVAIVTVILAMTVYPAALLLGGYFLTLLIVALLVFFGWDLIEAAYGGSTFPAPTEASRISADELPDDTQVRLRHHGITEPTDAHSRWDILGMSDLRVALTIVLILVLLVTIVMTVLVSIG